MTNKNIFRTLTKKERLDLLHGDNHKEINISKPINNKSSRKVKKNKKYIPYDIQLSDKRWIKRRNEVLQIKGKRCSVCGTIKNLHVHHIRYLPNKYAWEYKMKDLVVLCKDCHQKAHCIDLDKRLDFILKNEK